MEFDTQEFTHKVFKVCQSFEDFIMKRMEFSIYVTTTCTGKGHGRDSRKSKAPINADQNSLRKTSVVTIKNKGNLDQNI